MRIAALVLTIVTAFSACNRQSSTASAAQPAQKTTARAIGADLGQPQPSAPSGNGASIARNNNPSFFQTQTGLPHADGARALQYTREVVAFGPRYVGSPGHAKTEAYLRQQLKADNLQEDTFTATTPAGHLRMTNFIAKFPGSKDGIIVISGHYDTLYGRKDFVGANDAGSSTGLLLELARQLRGRKLEGYSVWLVWFDGEEAIKQWSETDSIYGSKHLATTWQHDGTLKKLKAFLLLDMVGDADLNIDRDSNSTPWLQDVVYKAATDLGYQSHFFARALPLEDDHIPFARAGVPVADLIDFSYGPNNSSGGPYWHTPQDTLDKLSPQSFEIVGSVVLRTIRLLNQS